MNHADKTPIFVRNESAKSGVPTALGVVVLESADPSATGNFFTLVERLSVGRTEEGDVNLAIDDSLMSRRHFTIEKSGDAYWLSDQSSTNGTFLEGNKVSRVQLPLGAIVRAGETFFEFNQFPTPLPKNNVGKVGLIWYSVTMQKVVDSIKRVARTAVPVFIEGETGTGKELIARRVHEESGRTGLFVAINCAAIPAELTESYFFGHKKGSFTGATADSAGHWMSANDGTLFLDEIGELPQALQAKMLRVLESGEVTPVGTSTPLTSSARVVAATNAHVDEKVDAGEFRRDLYGRLAVYTIHSPALRERRGDIPLLFRHFLALQTPGKEWTIAPEFFQKLIAYSWPGNVRELRSLAQRLALDAADAVLDETHLPDIFRASGPAVAGATDDVPSRTELERLLSQHQGRIADVATELNKDRKQIYRWLKRHGLNADDFRPE